MKIERVLIDSLHHDPANVRKHNEKNVMAIKASLAKFGQQKPIVVDKKNIVIAGNGTLEAAKTLGWKDIAIVRTELTGTDATGYAISDNRTAELAEWDFSGLAKQLGELDIAGFDLGEFGFDPGDINTPNFEPGNEDDQGKLDEKKKILCPSCSYEFTP